MDKSMSCFSIKKTFESKSKKTFMIYGGLLLEKLIGFCDGRSNPIRIFSVEELKRATNNFDERVYQGRHDMYKGVHQGRPIFVKKCPHAGDGKHEAINEIVYASGMSVHRNVLKFLGCCLEANCPFLVFETAKNETLAELIYDRDYAQFQPMPWKTRLKIAVDIANAVVYLHTAFQRPIVHTDINPSNVLLDEHEKAKLFDFSSCVSIPEGESHVEKSTIRGMIGFIAPECATTFFVSEKSDVYSFGVFLLVLLTGQRSFTFCPTENPDVVYLVPYVKSQIENNRFEEIVDPCIVAEGTWLGKEQQLKAVICLAILCVNESSEERPTMIEVAKELRNIYRAANGPC